MSGRWEELKTVIGARGLSQRGFAKAMGVNEVTVSRWLKRKTNPSLDALRQMAGVLSVTVDELLGIKPITLPFKELTDKAAKYDRIKKIMEEEI